MKAAWTHVMVNARYEWHVNLVGQKCCLTGAKMTNVTVEAVFPSGRVVWVNITELQELDPLEQLADLEG